MFWEVTFFDHSFGYIESLTIISAANKIQHQNWKVDTSFITKIVLVDNGFNEQVVDGWYSGNN